MAGFAQLLRTNRNYRYTWMGQVVSEIGDHFNNIAVFSLAMANTKSGLVVSGIMLSRAVAMLVAGPLAGVLLDRADRRRVMLASDVIRGLVGIAFIAAIPKSATNLLYVLSGMLMFASPFFTSGRSAILPTIATAEELHTANTLTQTTQWLTLTIGGMLAGLAVQQFGYEWAFVLNACSFTFSAWCIWMLRLPPEAREGNPEASRKPQPWRDFREGLAYMSSIPLIFAIAMINVGWASGGGAAQILFGLFGDVVFNMGSVGIGTIWGSAGAGLVVGGMFAHWLGPRLGFGGYKRTIAICYVVHGLSYAAFSQMQAFWAALLFIALSRAAVAVSSVLNMGQLLLHVADEYRGRVFATLETIVWSVMTLSMVAAGAASETVDPRTIGFVAGLVSSTTAIYWWWTNAIGRLPEPPRVSDAIEDAEEDIPTQGAVG